MPGRGIDLWILCKPTSKCLLRRFLRRVFLCQPWSRLAVSDLDLPGRHVFSLHLFYPGLCWEMLDAQ